MSYREVTYIGVAVISPEMVPCTLLFDAAHQRVLPIWLPEPGVEALEAIEEGRMARRPSDTDVLQGIIETTGAEIEALRIDSVYQGVYHCSLQLRALGQVDCKPSQLLPLAQSSGVGIEVHEQVLADASVKVAPQEFLEYFGIETPEHLDLEGDLQRESASGDEAADADFAAFMEQMGMKESDLFQDGEDD
ncbi:bifunctional nuclease family protein [Corynebacterium gerontici]|uniref:BFN domain-containing protein n=1 Tax=Corynebacterium gerontici TaxID=2079234 RepID=A0A3G6J017_9CORY|nr:bifunctional nuclease domain-containing protein [Corynebacterium gerontici]AZA11381.1 hypothetical protein CGERO_05365 [Corynebacterium gerontici]